MTKKEIFFVDYKKIYYRYALVYKLFCHEYVSKSSLKIWHGTNSHRFKIKTI